jgi:hypothetical protein
MPDLAVCDGKMNTMAGCKNAFGGAGMWIRTEGGRLTRSTDGVRFTQVYADDSGNYVPGISSIAWGWAPAR